MKRLFLPLFLGYLVLVSCQNDVLNVEIPQPDPDPENSTKVTYENALKSVEELLELFDSPETRSGSPKRIAECYTVGEPITTRTSDPDADPFLYIFNFEEEQGFAIISGDTRTTPVFAFVESGNLPKEGEIDNPGLIHFLTGMQESYYQQIEESSTISTRATTYSYSSWTRWDYYNGKGTTFVNWGQKTPYNLLSPQKDGQRCVAGCGPTAIAQLCAYYKFPSSFGGYTFDWNVMTTHENNSRPGVMNSAAFTPISRFYERVSTSNNLCVNFGLSDSSTPAENLTRTLKNLGFSNSGKYTGYSTNTVINEMLNGYPVLAAGWSTKVVTKVLGITVNKSYSNGHVWLVDNIIRRDRNVYKYVNGKLSSTTLENEYLIRCNWGWDGDHNGYFYSGAFDAKSGPAIAKAGEDNYAYNQHMVYNIRK